MEKMVPNKGCNAFWRRDRDEQNRRKKEEEEVLQEMTVQENENKGGGSTTGDDSTRERKQKYVVHLYFRSFLFTYPLHILYFLQC